MSFIDGMAALKLEMPDRVPRSENSADFHWPLVREVTGIEVFNDSPWESASVAAKAFRRAWNYDYIWSTLTSREDFGNKRTNMGHAVYAENGTDKDENISKLFNDPEDVFDFDCLEELGRKNISGLTKRFNEHYDSQVNNGEDLVNMTGIYVTCISGLIDLLGWETLLEAAGIDSEKFGAFTNRYCEWIDQYFRALAESKAPVVMIHDDLVWTSGPFIAPEWYRKYVFPNFKRMFGYLKEAGKIIMFTSDGDFTAFVDDIAPHVNAFVMEPMTDFKYIAEKYGKTHAFVGNTDTRVLLFGSKDDIYNEVKRVMDIGKKHPGFFMSVGNHIPPNTPVDAALYYNEIYEKMSRR